MRSIQELPIVRWSLFAVKPSLPNSAAKKTRCNEDALKIGKPGRVLGLRFDKRIFETARQRYVSVES